MRKSHSAPLHSLAKAAFALLVEVVKRTMSFLAHEVPPSEGDISRLDPFLDSPFLTSTFTGARR